MWSKTVFLGSATAGYEKYRPSPSNPPYSDHNPQLMLTYLHALWKKKIDEIPKCAPVVDTIQSWPGVS